MCNCDKTTCKAMSLVELGTQMGFRYVPKPIKIHPRVEKHSHFLEAANGRGFIRELTNILTRHLHSFWALDQMKHGWTYDKAVNLETKTDNKLRSFDLLTDKKQKELLDHVFMLFKVIYHHGYNVREEEKASSRHSSPGGMTVIGDAPSPSPSRTSMDDNLTNDLLKLKDTTLGQGKRQLVEVLAQSAHEMWAHDRLKEGWHFATKATTQGGMHWSPRLVPYEHLRHDQRDAMRRQATEFVRGLCSRGYDIVPPRRPTLVLSKISSLNGTLGIRRMSTGLRFSETQRREIQEKQQHAVEAQSTQTDKQTILNVFLLVAARTDDTDILGILDRCGVDINYRDDKYRHSALYLAVKVICTVLRH